MTGDIRAKLASSEAAESLRMESLIASCFRSLKWPAEQGVYYSDPETGKDREIDVISRHILERPRRQKNVGAPLINLSVICECKSLSGWNVLLQHGEREFHENMVGDHWSGHDERISELIELILSRPAYRKSDGHLLYSYYSHRAHPDNRQLTLDLKLLQPPVDLVATAYRATKSGAEEKPRLSDREIMNPIWSTIRSILSATKAVELSSSGATKSWTDIKPYHLDKTRLAQDLAFFFDVELTRRVLFHPVIFCKARLFCIDDDLKEVRSARLFVRNLDFQSRYVDLVRFDCAADYIGAMLSDFDKQAHKAIRKTWDRLEELHWQPGQASDRLAQALGFSKRAQVKPGDKGSGKRALTTMRRKSRQRSA